MPTNTPAPCNLAGPLFDPPHWRHDLLTPEEEHALAVRVRGGDAAARDELILRNQRLVISLARRHLGGFHTLGDLVSAGNRGLIRAVDLFDPGRGVRFATYASRWVRATIQREVVGAGFPIRVSACANGLVRQYERAEHRLSAGRATAPAFEEVCEAINVPRKWRGYLADALRARRAEYATDNAWAIPARDERDAADDDARTAAVSALLARLSPCQQQSIRLYYGLAGEPPMSLQEIGRRLGCTWQAAQDARTEGLRKLRRIAGGRHLALIS